MPEKTVNLQPPYLSVKKLEELLDLVSSKNLASVPSLSPGFFSAYGFSGSDANLAIAALRFLGLLDANSAPTNRMQKMTLKGDEPRKALAEMVQAAYSKLFEMSSEANKATSNDLFNDFVVVYSLSPRLASGAVRSFIFLCEKAGLREAEARAKSENPAPRVKKTPVHTKKQKVIEQTGKTAPSTGQTSVPFSGGDVVLLVPTKVFSTPTLIPEYQKLITAIEEFVAKLPVNNSGV